MARLALFLLAVGVVGHGTAAAAVPQAFDYQGLALDPNGVPLNGSVAATFRLFDVGTGGTELWVEAHPAVSVVDGVFGVTLGGITPLTSGLLDSPELWLEVTLDLETLTPRQRIVAVPYALRAGEAEQISLVCSEGDALRFVGGQWACGGVCSPGDSLFCYTGPPPGPTGACHGGQRTCDAAGVFGSCEGEGFPSPEICCNNQDEDCDGIVSNGCAQPNGAVCACNSGCSSGLCVDGTCCDSLCSGECESCASGICGNDPPGTACGQSASCTASGALPQDQCDGAGICVDPPEQTCTPYNCVNGACFTTCTTGFECDAQHYCDTGASQCIPRLAIGEPCTAGFQCLSGFPPIVDCIDNVCTVVP